MHDLDRLVCKFVSFDDALDRVRFIFTDKVDGIQTMPADHLYNETALSHVGMILNIAFAAFHCSVFISDITQTTFENREKGLVSVNYNKTKVLGMVSNTLLYNWHVKRDSRLSVACLSLVRIGLKLYLSKNTFLSREKEA